MISRYIKYFFISLFFIIAQTSVVQFLTLEGITPDILVIWIVYLALKEGQLRATIFGFIIGLTFDLVTGNFIGISALSKTVAGFTAGYFYGENKINLILGSYRLLFIVLVTSYIHNVIYFLIFTQGSEINLWLVLFHVGLITTIYTVTLALIPMFVFARKHLT
jgi:rod shape-determining protein MreD